ncbi:MAG: excinuclease ABC subunit UvrA [Akkermansiaceae bacterium]|nr:excinuclease ABC subunit UvrA [Akkermansiaceae bacterium]
MIRIRGARQHNLRNLDLEIPREQLVVVTGPSGSGKSSLAFHTLFAEGQRRFVESLSAYARQFLDQLEKPDVDGIDGLSPAIAIEQRSGGLNPRSTVATATEIYEHLRVLWAAAGSPHDPETGERLEKMGAADIVAALSAEEEGTKVVVLAPVPREEAGDAVRLAADLKRQGFVRVRVDGEMLDLDEAAAAWPERAKEVEVVVDRLVVRAGAESRIADSVETALRICGAESKALVQRPGAEGWETRSFQTSYRNPRTGFMIGELTPRHFSFNSHLGACPACEGLGTERFCDPGLLVDDPSKPLDEAVKGWWKPKSQREKAFKREAEAMERMFDVAGVAFSELPENLKSLLFSGGMLETGWKVGAEKKPQIKRYEGLCVEAERKLREARSEAVRRRVGRVMSDRPCRACGGRRLKPEVLAVKIGGSSWLGIQDFCGLAVEDALAWLREVRLPEDRAAVCGRLVSELREKLEFLDRVGLGYLGLDRASGTLSGGEAQRIRLATQLGIGLTGVMYVLDEPSIGLHAEDTGRLVAALKDLRDRGNTVIVVEHDEAVIRAADWLVELGPGAGSEGGYLLANGPMATVPGSPTKEWLGRGPTQIRAAAAFPSDLEWGRELVIRGARANNLRDLHVRIPLGGITCLCGPSGSGKSTLADDILMRAMRRHFHGSTERPGEHDGIDGFEHIGKAVIVDQSPIGRSPRSNPATFTGAFDLIRDLFSKLPLSRQRGYGAGRFSFNTRGGRCERCEGAGRLRIEMHFLPDAWVPCGACGGRRFNRETLEVAFKGLNIADVLELPVAEAAGVFAAVPKLSSILRVIADLGLGYLRLGQAADTLSGGEAQRLKLAVELARPAAPHTFYFFDEPTTGLHFGDVERLLTAFRSLREAGHTVLVVEHHLDVIRAADHVIDLGPGGGRRGGRVVAVGTPTELAAMADSPTGRALAGRGASIKQEGPTASLQP